VFTSTNTANRGSPSIADPPAHVQKVPGILGLPAHQSHGATFPKPGATIRAPAAPGKNTSGAAAGRLETDIPVKAEVCCLGAPECRSPMNWA
jgi:hypothetical protein